MLDKFIHVNSKGEVLDFFSLGMFANYNDLRDYEWSYTSAGDKIKRFKKGIVKKTVPFIFKVDPEKATALKDKFYEHFEIDVVTAKHGYFKVGDYRYYCYLDKYEADNYLLLPEYVTLKCELVTDQPFWVQEKTWSFWSSETSDYGYLDYTYDYKYDFSAFASGSRAINIDHFKESDFKLTIYGPATLPRILFNGRIYQVYTTLSKGEYLVIDSKYKIVTKHLTNGKVQNCFDLRNKQYSVFEKMPSGSLTAVWDASFGFDLMLYLERSQPKWNL